MKYLDEKNKFEELLKASILPPPYFPLSILTDTRRYLNTIADQCNKCYQYQQYNACFVMLRKLLEILIIKCFESRSIASKIKDGQGYYYMLSDLIDRFTKETTISFSRNTPAHLSAIKFFGDKSAHGRHFIARQDDLKKIQNDVRVIEELVHLVDYPAWNTRKATGVP